MEQTTPHHPHMKLLIGVKLMNGGHAILTLSYDLVSGNVALVPLPLGVWRVISDLWSTDLGSRVLLEAGSLFCVVPYIYIESGVALLVG